jgi:hypothetical protein
MPGITFSIGVEAGKVSDISAIAGFDAEKNLVLGPSCGATTSELER